MNILTFLHYGVSYKKFQFIVWFKSPYLDIEHATILAHLHMHVKLQNLRDCHTCTSMYPTLETIYMTSINLL
jgi:hypothetical protein